MRQLDLLFRVAERLDGFPRHIALHPCGIVLASHDLVERVPLERSANGHRMIQADKDDVELLGYLKLDILGRADALVDAPRDRRDRRAPPARRSTSSGSRSTTSRPSS